MLLNEAYDMQTEKLSSSSCGTLVDYWLELLPYKMEITGSSSSEVGTVQGL